MSRRASGGAGGGDGAHTPTPAVAVTANGAVLALADAAPAEPSAAAPGTVSKSSNGTSSSGSEDADGDGHGGYDVLDAYSVLDDVGDTSRRVSRGLNSTSRFDRDGLVGETEQDADAELELDRRVKEQEDADAGKNGNGGGLAGRLLDALEGLRMSQSKYRFGSAENRMLNRNSGGVGFVYDPEYDEHYGRAGPGAE